jgi:hypothetical protein
VECVTLFEQGIIYFLIKINPHNREQAFDFIGGDELMMKQNF